ncbi:DNA-binding protein SMUBP-2-like [Liolophura sinensis]|uniref:DNA-binding protein SMUBP-2-like n=1 Tax=Liolophura sinensis TaxID=3198878 RepID=UPI00315869E4
MAVEKFVAKTLELLEIERDAEIEETRVLHENLPAKELQRRGVCLLKLRIAERRTGLYGRSIVTFEPHVSGQELPSHTLSPGDIVSLSLTSCEKGEVIASGIISKVWQAALSVAFDETMDTFSLADEEKYKLVKLANNITYKRLKRALNELNRYCSGPANHLVNVLFELSDRAPPSDPPDVHVVDITFCNPCLDTSQRDAVSFALCQKDIAVIHGPPGTGKTTTVVEVIVQAIRQGLKVLACAPSNIAVDNLVERLANQKLKILRIGHPARFLPHIHKFSLDAILATSDETKVVEDVRKDVDKTLMQMKKVRDKGERHHLREELKHLRKELRQREAAATRDVLKAADVVLVTLTSCTDDGPLKYLPEGHFDLTVIDECSQALEAACWLSLLRSPRCVLAGDHLQLPPTILSSKAAKAGLERTLMERVLEVYGDGVMKMLTVQYRMHELIMNWSSNQLYGGQLTAHESVCSHLLRDLDNVEDSEDTRIPLLLIDTAGCDLYELDLPEEISKGNEGEADIVSCHIERLVASGVKPRDIAVIAPYNLQVELLRIRLSTKYPDLEIKSVDGFQGREKTAVIISMVRSNNTGEVGFLAERRRINVAITRAQRHLAVVCDTETVNHDEFLKSLTEYMCEFGEVRSAQEYDTENAPIQRPDHVTELFTKRNVQTVKANRGGNSRTGKPQQKRIEGSKDVTKRYGKQQETEKKPDIPIEEDPRYAELHQTITDFQQESTKQEHVFPVTLTSRDRFIIHEIAEKLGLSHSSQGEGNERQIAIRKNTQKQQKPKLKPNVKGNLPESNSHGILELSVTSDSPLVEDWAVELEDKTETVKPLGKTDAFSDSQGNLLNCQYCGKNVIRANLVSHEAHCQRVAKPVPLKKPNSAKPKSAVKKKNNSSKSAIDQVDPDDFEALLAAATEQNSKCTFRKCKSLTTTLGQTCEFCLQRFCLNHHMPEVHGCGNEAKSKARHVIIKEGILHRGSGFKETKLDPEKKAQLQRKLDKKLGDMSENRRAKKPQKNKD